MNHKIPKAVILNLPNINKDLGLGPPQELVIIVFISMNC